MTTLSFGEIKYLLEQLERFEKAIALIAGEKVETKKESYIKLANKILNDVKTKVDKDMKVLPVLLYDKQMKGVR